MLVYAIFVCFFYKKNRALNSIQHRTLLKVIFTVELTQKKGQKSSEMDFQLVAYEIFSSIERRGEREGKEGCGKVGGVWEGGRVGGGVGERTIAAPVYTCYMILCI